MNKEGFDITSRQLYGKVLDSLELSRFMVPSRSKFSDAVRQVRGAKYREGGVEPLVLVSTVCPPYSTDENGRPDYRSLEVGVSYNIEQHLLRVPPAVKVLEEAGLDVVHMFLMADTEVDLHPFLEKKLGITPDEFIQRCHSSVEAIAERVIQLYGGERYNRFNLPPADRFLNFFGADNWYYQYGLLKTDLIAESTLDPEAVISQSLRKDYKERKRLVFELLGQVGYDQGIDHIARQKAQYMAFGRLVRECFGKRVFIFNHTTPNLRSINDMRSRFLRGDQYIPRTALFELDISSMPGENL